MIQTTIPFLSHEYHVPLIVYSTSKSIQQYRSANEFLNLDKFLLTYSKFLGINPAPEKDERLMIIGFLKENFYDFSKEEIEKAFNMALAFKLDIPESQLNPYNTLSPIWISTILNRYRNLRTRAIHALEKKITERVEETKDKITKEERDQIMYDAMIRLQKQYKETKEFKDLGASVFNWISVRTGMYPQILIDKYVEMAMPLVRSELKGEKIRTNDPIRMLAIESEITTQFTTNENDHGAVYFKARHLILKELFDDQIKFDKLVQELKPIK